jgi:ankyrin repeat protein
LKNFDCIVALLIDFGAHLHAKNVAGNTPLHISATRNFKESVKWLLQRGADPTSKNKSGKTALELAEQSNSDDTTSFLKSWNPINASNLFMFYHSFAATVLAEGRKRYRCNMQPCLVNFGRFNRNGIYTKIS